MLNLYHNVFSEGVPRNRSAPITGGVTLQRVTVGDNALENRPVGQVPIGSEPASAPTGYSVQGTLARVRLPAAVPPGDSVVLEIDWDMRPRGRALLDLDQTPAFDPTQPEPIPDWPPITAHPATTPTATSASLRFDFDQTRGA